MKFTIEDYENHIRELIETSSRTRDDLIAELNCKGLNYSDAVFIVDKCVNEHNSVASPEKTYKYLRGLFLLIGAIPVAIFLIWYLHVRGVDLTARVAVISIAMIIIGVRDIKKAKRINII